MSHQNKISCKKKGKPTRRSQSYKTIARNNVPSLTSHNGLFIPQEPPGVNPAPWMPLITARIVTFGYDNNQFNGLLQAKQLVVWVTEQLDPNSKYFAKDRAPVYIKIDNVMLWNLTGKSIALTAYDMNTGDVNQVTAVSDEYEQLGSWFDSGSGNTPPKVGFRWPTAQRNRVLSDHVDKASGYGEGQRHLIQFLAPKGDQIMIHFRLSWRLPASGKEMLQQMIGIRDIHAIINEQTKAIQDTAKQNVQMQEKIYSALPNKILGNVPVWIANLPVISDAQDEDEVQSRTSTSFEVLQSENSQIKRHDASQNIDDETSNDRKSLEYQDMIRMLSELKTSIEKHELHNS